MQRSRAERSSFKGRHVTVDFVVWEQCSDTNHRGALAEWDPRSQLQHGDMARARLLNAPRPCALHQGVTLASSAFQAPPCILISTMFRPGPCMTQKASHSATENAAQE